MLTQLVLGHFQHWNYDHLTNNLILMIGIPLLFRISFQQQTILLLSSTLFSVVATATFGPLPYKGMSHYTCALITFSLMSALPLIKAVPSCLLLIFTFLLDWHFNFFHHLHLSSLPPAIKTAQPAHIAGALTGILVASLALKSNQHPHSNNSAPL